MVQMAFCDLSHTYHKQVTNVSPTCFCHPTVVNFDVSPKAHDRRCEYKFLFLLTILDIRNDHNNGYDIKNDHNNGYDIRNGRNNGYDIRNDHNNGYDIKNDRNNRYDIRNDHNNPYDIRKERNNGYMLSEIPTIMHYITTIMEMI